VPCVAFLVLALAPFQVAVAISSRWTRTWLDLGCQAI
jgi:hypothetical protein